MSAKATPLPRKVTNLILSFAPVYVAIGFLQIVIGAWMVTVGFTPAQAGALLSVEGVCLILSAIPLGLVSDIYGRRNLLLLGALVGAAGLLAFALTTDYWALLTICAVLGVAEGASYTSWNALLADMTDASNRNRAFSLSYVMTNVAAGVGFALPGAFPFLQGALGVTGYSLHRDFLLALGAASFVTPLGAYAVLRGHIEARGSARGWGGFKDKLTLGKLGFVAATIGFGAGFIVPLVGSWFYFRFGVSDSYSGPVLALSSILMGFSAAASPSLARRFGQLRAILITMGSSMLLMLSMAFLPFFALAAGVYVVRTALMNMSAPLIDSFSMSIFPAEQRGVVSAVNNVVFNLPNSISTYLGGVILGLGLLQLPFYLASGLYAVGLSGFYVFFVAGKRYAHDPAAVGAQAGSVTNQLTRNPYLDR